MSELTQFENAVVLGGAIIGTAYVAGMSLASLNKMPVRELDNHFGVLKLLLNCGILGTSIGIFYRFSYSAVYAYMK